MITRKRKDEQINFEQPTAEIFEDNDVRPQEKEQDDRYDRLAQQLADMQTRLGEAEKANMALLSTPPNYSQVNDQFVEQDINKIELPDPALDPKGFSDASIRRGEVAAENRRRRDEFNNRKQNEIAEKVDSLWADFGDKYPDMADDKDRIDFISTAIAKDALKRGVNVERYMFLTRDKFIDDVAAKYISVFGDPSDGDADFEEDRSNNRRAEARPAPRRRTNNRDRSEDEYVGRTGGIFGGTESGSRPSRTRNDDEDNGPSMLDDIQALQRKTGFF